VEKTRRLDCAVVTCASLLSIQTLGHSGTHYPISSKRSCETCYLDCHQRDWTSFTQSITLLTIDIH